MTKNIPTNVLKRLYQKGLPMVEIGKKLGIDTATVSRHLRAIGVVTRPPGTPQLNLPMDKITEMYRSGLSIVAIGKKFGVDDSTIWRRLRKAGVGMRSRGRAKAKD